MISTPPPSLPMDELSDGVPESYFWAEVAVLAPFYHKNISEG